MSKPMTAKQIAAKAESMELPELTDMLEMVAEVDTTPERRKILATKCLPQAAGWNQAQKVAYAGVCQKTWYNAERDPKFRQLCIDFVRDRLGVLGAELWATYVRLALDGDRQALERVLQQLGIIDKPEKNSIDVNLTGQISVAAAAQKQVDNLKQKIGAVEEEPSE